MIYRIFTQIFLYFALLYHSVFKYALRFLTKLCELQRICYGTKPGALRCLKIEKSFEKSKSPVIIKINKELSSLSFDKGNFNCDNKRNVVDLVEKAVQSICKTKKINKYLHSDFLNAMRISLLQIYGYKQLCHDIFELKNTAYDSNNIEHENYLISIWKNLNPYEDLGDRISKKWTEIGFQGNDPKTDFRGMGILGLINLHYFTTKYSSTAQSILSHSNHPVNGYPFAITGINITHMAYVLLNNNKLKTHFYNTYLSTMTIDDFNKLYCYLFVNFDRLWIKEKPKDVMEFSFIKEKFLDYLNEELSSYTCKLIWEPSSDLI